MALRGTKKELSQRQENEIARLYNGKVSKSSGGAKHDAGDVRTADMLIECKYTGDPSKHATRPTWFKQLEKVADEAWGEGKSPMLALRFYIPLSKLANADGWVDVSVRLVCDDIDLIA